MNTTTPQKRVNLVMYIPTAEELKYWGFALGALLSGVALWRKLKISHYIGLAWHKTLGRDHAIIFENLAALSDQMNEVVDQVRPNGHGSIQVMLVEIIDKLEENQSLTGARLNADHQAIFLTDKDGKVTKNNRMHSIMTGFSFEELKGDGWINVIHPDDREKVHRKWDNAVKEHREFSETIRYVTHSGHVYNVHVDVYRQLDSKGELRGYLGVVHHEGSEQSPQNKASGGEKCSCGDGCKHKTGDK